MFSEVKEAIESVGRVIPSKLEESGLFMVAVWTVQPDGKMLLNRTTFKFPTARMSEAVELLRNNLQREQLEPVEMNRDPLPEASGELLAFLANRKMPPVVGPTPLLPIEEKPVPGNSVGTAPVADVW